MEGESPPLVLIPAYNEEGSIQEVIQSLRREAPAVDLLVINDHSTDGTRRVVEALGVRQLFLPCNLGYRGAVQIGCAWALENGYERVVFFDGDGQHPASAVLPMVEKIDQGDADIVVASRYAGGESRGATFGRFLGNQLFSRLASLLTGQRITDSTSGMKALGPAVLRCIAEGDFLDIHAEALVYLGMRGFRISEHPAVFTDRRKGTSMYGRLSMVRYPLLTGTLLICSMVRAWLDRRQELVR